MNTLAYWSGAAGDDYTARNPVTAAAVEARRWLWAQMLDHIFPEYPRSVLEVGANVGLALRGLRQHLPSDVRYFATEPNERARQQLVADGVVYYDDAYAGLGDVVGVTDLVFTSGVLIHVVPDDLLTICREIHDHAARWIVSIEYFSQKPEEIEYHGEMGRLWKRDFGAFWLDNFDDLKPVGCGFAWKRMTGLDDVTYWIFERQ